jgi:predicted TIM-barrel fold metal-dependent hydrolase
MHSRFRATAPGFDVPANTTDCHMHIVGSPDLYPFVENRSFCTNPATVEDYRKTMAATGIGRAVIIQPSFYGTDSRCTIDALDSFGGCARGVAVVEPDITDGELERLHEAGFRGLRVNMHTLRSDTDEPIDKLVRHFDARVRPLRWHIQLFVAPENLPALAKVQDGISCPLVIDHFGMLRCEMTMQEPMRSCLAALEAILDGGGWVKLSGLYRVADDPMAPSLADLARRLHARAPDRVVWASDWPHTPPHGHSISDDAPLPYRDIDTGSQLAPVAYWFPDSDTQRQVLVENPARLYDFA